MPVAAEGAPTFEGRNLPVTDPKTSSLLRALLLGAALTFLLLLAIRPATAAADEPFKIEFDQSSIQIGLVGDLPLNAIASGASLEGTIDETGNVTVPKGKFQLPELGLDEPVKIRGYMGVESDATGTFNRATGQLELDAKAGIWLTVDVAAVLELAGLDIGDLIGDLGGIGGIGSGLINSQLRNLTCGFSPMDVHFTTETNSLAGGSRFIDGPTGTGAITAEWSQLGPFSGRTKILGLIDPCQLILDQLPGLLEGGLGGIGGDLGGIDLGDFDLAGLLSNLDNLDLGPSAIVLTRSQADLPADPVDPADPADPVNPGKPVKPRGSARLKLAVAPKKRRVRAGKATVFRTRVKNTGNATARNVRLCLTGPGRGILNRWRCVKFGQVKPGATKVRRIKVRVRRNAQRKTGGFRFSLKSANAANRSTGARLRILR